MNIADGRPQADPPRHQTKLVGVSLVVVDDNAFIVQDGDLKSRGGDFHRFVAQLGMRVEKVTLCSPVLNLPSEPGRSSHKLSLSFEGSELIPTFPYVRLTQYVLRLPLALRQNTPALVRAMRSGSLVLIRAPAANAILAFVIARVLRKPTVLFLVGPPAAGALSGRHRRALRGAIRLAAWLEWTSIIWMARRVPVFAYGSHLAGRLKRSGARDVSVTFTSLVESIPALPERRISQPPFKVLFVGRFGREKGLDTLLDGLSLLLADKFPVHLDLVGDGPLATELRSRAALLEDKTVQFHGWLPEGPDLNRLFDQADLFVQPSRQEGIPKVLVKAMAYGLPIVATCIGGIPDIVSQGVQGLLIPADDPVRLAQAMRIILDDSDLGQRLGKAGREFANAHTASKQSSMIWKNINMAFPDLGPLADGVD
jgi:glycosyltransferase involved in cell wall biosynthesis